MHVLYIGSRRLAPYSEFSIDSVHHSTDCAWWHTGAQETLRISFLSPRARTLHGGSGRPASSTCSKGHEHR